MERDIRSATDNQIAEATDERKMPRILVVEDEFIVAMDIQNRLERLGYEALDSVASGEEAVQRAGELLPDLVLMDIRLEGEMDGIEAADHIHSQFNIPVIFLTAFADEETLQRAKITAPYGYILKPFQERELHSAIEIALHNHQLENKLKKSEERFRDLIETAEEVIWEVDRELRITYSNPYIEKVIGYLPSELIGKPMTSFMHKDDRKKFKKLISEIIDQQNGWKDVLLRWRHKDGTYHWLDSSAVSIMNGSGKSKGFRGTDRDVTEKKRMEKELFQYQQMQQLVFDHIPLDVFWKDRNSIYLGCNRKFAEDVGVSDPADIIGKNDLDYFPKETANLYRIDDKTVMETNTPKLNYEEPLYTPDGTKLQIRTNKVPLKDEKGKVIGVLGTYEDITANKKLEQQLRQSQKMEAIGVLAGGIAHDFNNILTSVLGYADLAMDSLGNVNGTKADLKQIMIAGNRAKDLVAQILTFSRQEEFERQPIQISLIIKEALKLIRASLPSTIEIRQNVTNQGTILSDATQIHQVVMNICTNAYHAMGDKGGVLEVDLSQVEIDSISAGLHTDLKEGSYLKLTISDTGRGMDEETQKRIFDPFFTTKKSRGGTGLGLSVVHGIIKSHEGSISVYSEVGKGTTFHLYFPRSIGKAEERHERDEKLIIGNERILLVEDEDQIAKMEKRGLKKYGYDVTVRTSSVEALAAFRKQPSQFDLVITDNTMPNMTGVELAQEILKIQPGIPIILLSGFSNKSTKERAKEIGIREFVVKPVIGHNLAKAVRTVLDNN